MMREIGSEFWDVPTANTETSVFPESTQWYLSGRSALQAIIQELRDKQSVAMPSWCCDSMIKPFVDAGLSVFFYPVYFRDGLEQKIPLDADILFLIDYFGYTQPQPDLSGYHGVVIRDVTHSLFSTAYSDADYSFGSLRKWCGLWTGGYAWTGDGHPLAMPESGDLGYTGLREKAMRLKEAYINKHADEDGNLIEDKGYLKTFDDAESLLENASISPAAERDVLLAQRLDINLIRSRRRANAAILRSSFREWLIFPELKDTDCPMFVPILVPDGRRDELRRFLIKNEIYCPIHWPVSSYHRLNEEERFICDNELSLVCDQRYTVKDMNRMVTVIESYWKGT